MLWPYSYCFLALKTFLTFRLLIGWTPYVGKKYFPLIPYYLLIHFSSAKWVCSHLNIPKVFIQLCFYQSARIVLLPPSYSGTLKLDLTFLLPVNTNSCLMNWDWDFFFFLLLLLHLDLTSQLNYNVLENRHHILYFLFHPEYTTDIT